MDTLSRYSDVACPALQMGTRLTEMVEPVHAGLGAEAEPPARQLTPRVPDHMEHPGGEHSAHAQRQL